MQLELDQEGGIPEEVAYTISRSMSAQRKGTFVIDRGGATFRAVLGALPPHADYKIQLSAAAGDEVTGIRRPCGGSGTFGVVAGEVTSLSIPIHCEAARGAKTDEGDEGDQGDVGDEPVGTNCPLINAIRAVPSEALVGQPVMVRSDVEDAVEHPERFHFAWSADTGTFSKVSAFQAGYVCTEVGIATLTVVVTNENTSCPEESAFVYVTCEEAP